LFPEATNALYKVQLWDRVLSAPFAGFKNKDKIKSSMSN
jgi:hypothetical protein